MFGSSENQTESMKGTEPEGGGGVSNRLPFFRSLGRFFVPVLPTTPAHMRGSFSEIVAIDFFFFPFVIFTQTSRQLC